MSSISTREHALRILERVETKKSYSTRLLDNLCNQSDFEPSQRAFLRRLVKGTLQWRLTIDECLNPLLKRGLGSTSSWIRNLLRLGTYQILYLDHIPPEVAAYEMVELAKKFGQSGSVKLVNAVLRKVVAQRQAPSDAMVVGDSVSQTAITYSHPLWIVRLWNDQLGMDQTRRLCEANNRPAPLYFRTNTLKTSTNALRKTLQEEGIEGQSAAYAPDCTSIITLPRESRIQSLRAYTNGWFQVQDQSSVLVGHLANPKPGELIVDLCSAPGGKTTHMAALMQNHGRIVAVDPYEFRLQLVRENCMRLGVSIVETLCANGCKLKLGQSADKVLVDAPCSGLGNLGRRADQRWNKSEEDVAGLRNLQLELLDNAATLVRHGGSIIYSTCTLNLSENQQVVEEFLSIHPECSLGTPPDHLPKELVDDCGYYYSWPHRHQMGGAFGALIVKA